MSGGRRDAIICGALVVATAVYLLWWPHDFDGFDEGMYLYEAKRILDGDVMYRDFFQIVTPAWFYLVAGWYALFGVSLETARALMTVVHAAIVAMIFIIARRVGLPWTAAVLLAVLHLTLGYPSCSITTPHWFSTLLCLVIVAVVLRSACETPLRAFAWGVLLGVLTLVQQQKGTVMAVGVALVVAMDLRGGLRLREPNYVRRLAGGLTAYLSGIGLTVGPVMLLFVALAGFDNVWNALVVYPVRNYPRIHQNIPWGFYVPGIIPWGFVIRWLPGIIPIAAALLLWRGVRGAGANQRQLIVLLIFSIFALLSVVYNRTYLHLALAAPLWFLLGGALVSSMAERSWRARALTRFAMHGVALVLIGLCLRQLVLTLTARRAALPSPASTVFGRIDTWGDTQPKLIEQVTALLRDQAGTEIFVYPANPGLYLITGLRNPTRYQIVLPGYTAEPELSEVIATLEKRRVELVVNHLYPGPPPSPLLSNYMRDHYEFVAKVGGNIVYRRKESGPSRPMF